MDIDLRTLISRLNLSCRVALEGAAEKCLELKHPCVESEHFLDVLLSHESTLEFRIWLSSSDVDVDPILREIQIFLSEIPQSDSEMPAIGQYLTDWLSAAWVRVSGLAGRQQIDICALFFAAVDDKKIRHRVMSTTPSLLEIPQSLLKKKLLESPGLSATTSEISTNPSDISSDDLKKFTYDLTEFAAQGNLDPITGRDVEIRQIIDILMRRRQNNPILTGEAGVGKTAIIEGLAQKINLGQVPPVLQGVKLKVLDLAALQAGASVKGAFEERLKSVIKSVTLSPIPIILFIDEAHQLIGAGGHEGTNDAANLLKPALARGELRTIAATTWGEYKKFFERDPALTRRFQVVKVEEPNEEVAIEMLRGITKSLETHHGVEILDEAVIAATKLSSRHIAGRQLPDKAVSVLDTACARLSLLQSADPPRLEKIQSELRSLKNFRDQVEREEAMGTDESVKTDTLQKQIDDLESEVLKLGKQFKDEREAVFAIVQTRRAIERLLHGESGEDDEPIELLQDRLIRLTTGLEVINNENQDIPIVVDANLVATVIEDWTGIPASKMIADEINSVLEFSAGLEEKVIGQEFALKKISKKIEIFRANLDDPEKPVGVFMLAGPSGVGKTETAHAVAEMLFSDTERVITVNLSEFQEAHSVALLKGAPPGYVGYGTGGILTEAVRRAPYSVVLLDEIEKAHPDVLELFYQVFDKGIIEDSEGVKISFKNTVILLTSNVGEEIISGETHINSAPKYESFVQSIQPVFESHFGTAFVGRVELLPYFDLNDSSLRSITSLKIATLKQRLKETHSIELFWNGDFVAWVASQCKESQIGARRVDQLISDFVVPQLAQEILGSQAAQQELTDFEIVIQMDGSFEKIVVKPIESRGRNER
tara:strand:- start:707 stop:3355 length:2649 start_codon:yes stop_codon:yes gene_type:complete